MKKIRIFTEQRMFRVEMKVETYRDLVGSRSASITFIEVWEDCEGGKPFLVNMSNVVSIHPE